MSNSPPNSDTVMSAWELPSLAAQPASRVRIVLGRCEASRPALEETAGVAIPLDRPLSASVDIEVDGCVVASGEVVVLEGRLAVRVTEVRDPQENAA